MLENFSKDDIESFNKWNIGNINLKSLILSKASCRALEIDQNEKH
jgi:hypothetical protein